MVRKYEQATKHSSERYFSYKRSDKVALIPLNRGFSKGDVQLTWHARMRRRKEEGEESSEDDDQTDIGVRRALILMNK